MAKKRKGKATITQIGEARKRRDEQRVVADMAAKPLSPEERRFIVALLAALPGGELGLQAATAENFERMAYECALLLWGELIASAEYRRRVLPAVLGKISGVRRRGERSLLLGQLGAAHLEIEIANRGKKVKPRITLRQVAERAGVEYQALRKRRVFLRHVKAEADEFRVAYCNLLRERLRKLKAEHRM